MPTAFEDSVLALYVAPREADPALRAITENRVLQVRAAKALEWCEGIARQTRNAAEMIERQMRLDQRHQAFAALKRVKASVARKLSFLDAVTRSLLEDDLEIDDDLPGVVVGSGERRDGVDPLTVSIFEATDWDARQAIASRWAKTCQDRFAQITGPLKTAVNRRDAALAARMLKALEAFAALFAAEARRIIAALTVEDVVAAA